MSRWTVVKLGDVVAETQYGTSKKANEHARGLPILRMNNITPEGHFDLSDLKHVELQADEIDRYTARPGDLLFNRTNSPDLVGKMGCWSCEHRFAIAGYLVRVRLQPAKADPRFVAAWFNTPGMKAELRARAKRSINMSNISATELLKFSLPLPPLPEQQRIADVLDRAEALRAKRRSALAQLDTLTQSIFLDMFGDLLRGGTPNGAYPILSDIADVVSGVAKGRKLQGRRTERAPYLRVANVQAGFLDLSEIKVIEALPSEVDDLSLVPGDVLVTEGGDHDKLGRGAMWEGQIQRCIHQNHIFRVRTDRRKVLPRFFLEYLQASTARAYFLRCAKRTTNLASINMTQLRALPVPLPGLDDQLEFTQRAAHAEKIRTLHRASLAELEALFSALQDRAFRGEL